MASVEQVFQLMDQSIEPLLADLARMREQAYSLSRSDPERAKFTDAINQTEGQLLTITRNFPDELVARGLLLGSDLWRVQEYTSSKLKGINKRGMVQSKAKGKNQRNNDLHDW